MQRERRREYFSLKLFYLALLLLVHIILVSLSIISVWAVHFDHPVNYHISKKMKKSRRKDHFYMLFKMLTVFVLFDDTPTDSTNRLHMHFDCHQWSRTPDKRYSKMFETYHHPWHQDGSNWKRHVNKMLPLKRYMIKINILNQIDSIPLKSLCWC